MPRFHARRSTVIVLRTLAILLAISASGIVSRVPVRGQTLRLTVRIAYVRGGNIWVVDEPSGRRTQLTHDGGDSAPHWIAAGHALLFLHGTAGGGSQTWRWQPGTGLRRLRDGLWSPDGTTVAFTRAVPGRGSPTTVWIAREGMTRRITPLQRHVHWYPLAWSPDGRRLALARIGIPPPFTPGVGQGVPPTPGSLWVTVGALTPAGLQQLPLPPSFQGHPGWPDVAFWSPNGRYLTVGVGPDVPCNSCRLDGHPYYAIPLAGGKPVSLGTALDGEAISWAQNASFAVLSSPLGRFTYHDKHLVRVDLATGVQTPLTHSAQWADTQPAVSPDGTRIAFVRGRGAPLSTHLTPQQLFGSRHVFLTGAKGGQLHQLTREAGWTDEAPVWSPDGGWTLFVRWRALQDRMEEPALWVVRANGRDAQRLAALSPAGGFPASIGYWGTFGWQELFDVAP